MKETRRIISSLLVCGVAFAMVSTLVAQSVSQGTATVVQIKGDARYKIGSNEWQPLKLGDVVKPGTLIQTAARAYVDLALGAGPSKGLVPGTRMLPSYQPATSGTAYHPSAEQNVVRMWENTLLSIDKLTSTQTGADVVTETQLDLKAGHIFGVVKKMSAASKYEVKIPNGVAGIRGTTYDIAAEGVIKVLSGSVVLAYAGPNGAVLTQVIMGKQMFDARTGTLTPLATLDETDMQNLVSAMLYRFAVPPSVIAPNQAFVGLVSPH
jgi:hypothetical protein